MSFLHYLSKKISRKNLYKFITEELIKRKDINCLNIGSGGPIEELLKKKVKNYYSIDIDHSRKPNEVIDVCSKDFKVNFNPNLAAKKLQPYFLHKYFTGLEKAKIFKFKNLIFLQYPLDTSRLSYIGAHIRFFSLSLIISSSGNKD